MYEFNLLLLRKLLVTWYPWSEYEGVGGRCPIAIRWTQVHWFERFLIRSFRDEIDDDLMRNATKNALKPAEKKCEITNLCDYHSAKENFLNEICSYQLRLLVVKDKKLVCSLFVHCLLKTATGIIEVSEVLLAMSTRDVWSQSMGVSLVRSKSEWWRREWALSVHTAANNTVLWAAAAGDWWRARN